MAKSKNTINSDIIIADLDDVKLKIDTIKKNSDEDNERLEQLLKKSNSFSKC